MSKLLPYKMIIKAHEGDPVGMNEVLSHYAGYIRYCSHIYTAIAHVAFNLYLPTSACFFKLACILSWV